jgi:hypothetical protein
MEGSIDPRKGATLEYRVCHIRYCQKRNEPLGDIQTSCYYQEDVRGLDLIVLLSVPGDQRSEDRGSTGFHSHESWKR